MSAVSEIMSPKSTVTANIDSNPSVLEVARLMVKNKVGSIVLVKDEGNPIGIVTERDILKKVSFQNTKAGQVQAKDIMSSPLFTVKAIDSIDTAAEAMVKNGVKRLVVVEQDGSVRGILSMSDIVKELTKILADDHSRYRSLRNMLELQR